MDKDRVTEHAKRVVSGEETWGELHILACKRHLHDLERQGTEEFPYIYLPEKAFDIVEYSETLTIAEGEEPKPLELLDCQAFDLGCTFGWVKMSDGKRRFRRRYKSVARQNGKTMENGIMGPYIAGFGNYSYGKLFTVATKKRQARLAWEDMARFITIDPDLAEYFSIKDYKSLIVAENTGCTIEALSRESGLDDGFRSIFSSIDEIHQHRDNKIYKALYNGTRALPETLISMITTRGDNLQSFCYEMDSYAINVLRGLATAEDFFVDIYALNPNDDIWDPKNWAKANPFIVSRPEQLKVLAADAQTAKDMGGSELRDFMTKSLNLWVQNTDNEFINADAWKACGSTRTLEDMRGKSCWVGLDLSSGGDLTTLALEFEDQTGGKTKYYFYSHSFMPRGRMQEHITTDLAPYDLWEQMELITVTGGFGDFKNDYKFIIAELKRLQQEFDLTFLGFGIDPSNADGFLADLEEFGVPVLLVKQNCNTLNDATVDIQLLTKSGNLEYHAKNELLTWSFLNARLVSNSLDMVKVDKRTNERFRRIDPVDACVDAHHALLKNRNKEVVDLDREMAAYLENMGWNK